MKFVYLIAIILQDWILIVLPNGLRYWLAGGMNSNNENQKFA